MLTLPMSLCAALLAASPYAFHDGQVERTVESEIAPPRGFHRLQAAPGSFAAWLRGLPLKPPGAKVHLHDGSLKANQEIHRAVIDIDVGKRDLQQCADAVMRLRAEYLFSTPSANQICFRFTSGDSAEWSRWQEGLRPKIARNQVSWVKSAAPDASRASFRSYLDTVFTFAGTASLAKELGAVRDPTRIEPGDVFIHGGFPGHAEGVVDVAENARGERVFLLAQSYMPAQEIHLLRNPGAPEDPWYPALAEGQLITPEWTFARKELRRFGQPGCGPK